MKIYDRKKNLSRRDFLKTALGGGLVISGLATTENLSEKISGTAAAQQMKSDSSEVVENHHAHGMPGTIGQVNHEANGFDPLSLLYEWDYGQTSQLPNGQILREFHIAAVDKEIEIL